MLFLSIIIKLFFSNRQDRQKQLLTMIEFGEKAHCLDILRQQLQCTVDVGVMGQIWYQPSTTSPSSGRQQQQQKQAQPFVDFNTKHTCRNFEEIRQWAFAHQIQEPTPEDFLEPPGVEDKIYQNIP